VGIGGPARWNGPRTRLLRGSVKKARCPKEVPTPPDTTARGGGGPGKEGSRGRAPGQRRRGPRAHGQQTRNQPPKRPGNPAGRGKPVVGGARWVSPRGPTADPRTHGRPPRTAGQGPVAERPSQRVPDGRGPPRRCQLAARTGLLQAAGGDGRLPVGPGKRPGAWQQGGLSRVGRSGRGFKLRPSILARELGAEPGRRGPRGGGRCRPRHPLKTLGPVGPAREGPEVDHCSAGRPREGDPPAGNRSYRDPKGGPPGRREHGRRKSRAGEGDGAVGRVGGKAVVPAPPPPAAVLGLQTRTTGLRGGQAGRPGPSAGGARGTPLATSVGTAQPRSSAVGRIASADAGRPLSGGVGSTVPLASSRSPPRSPRLRPATSAGGGGRGSRAPGKASGGCSLAVVSVTRALRRTWSQLGHRREQGGPRFPSRGDPPRAGRGFQDPWGGTRCTATSGAVGERGFLGLSGEGAVPVRTPRVYGDAGFAGARRVNGAVPHVFPGRSYSAGRVPRLVRWVSGRRGGASPGGWPPGGRGGADPRARRRCRGGDGCWEGSAVAGLGHGGQKVPARPQ
jgi:hypothetical protein